MSSKKLLVVAAVAALGLCFAQGASALHGGVSGGIKFTLSGTMECEADHGEMTSLFHNEVSPPYIEFKTSQDKTITCTRTTDDGVSPPVTTTGEFSGSFRTTGPLQISCAAPPATPAGTSKQTIASSCPTGDVEGTLTAAPGGGFTAGSVYNIGGADNGGFDCADVFPASGLPQNVILQSERFFSNESCGANEFSSGDVMVAVGNDSVQWWKMSAPLSLGTNPKTLTATLAPGVPSFTTGMAFDANNDLYVTLFGKDMVRRFDKNGVEIPLSFGGPYLSSPESIVFNAAGHAYIGKADGDADIHEVDANGLPVTTFNVATEDRGSDWIDLACNQKTMLYTSEGARILAYDVSSPGGQLGDFYVGPALTRPLFALRVIPSGPFAGQVLVANNTNVKRISMDGTTVLATYDAPGENFWFALDLDANGIHVWAADSVTANVYRFEIAGAGAHLPVQTFNTGTGANTVFGLRVKHGLNCGTQPLPSPTVLDGTMIMRPCGAEDVDTDASCVHTSGPIQNPPNTLTQANGIPAVSSPDDINVKDNKKKEGIWVAILENDFVPVGTIIPASLKVEGVSPETKKGNAQCVLDPGVSLRCRYSKSEVADALGTKYPGVGGGATVFMKVTGTNSEDFETSALVHLVP